MCKKKIGAESCRITKHSSIINQERGHLQFKWRLWRNGGNKHNVPLNFDLVVGANRAEREYNESLGNDIEPMIVKLLKIKGPNCNPIHTKLWQSANAAVTPKYWGFSLGKKTTVIRWSAGGVTWLACRQRGRCTCCTNVT